jgi:SulP family sulfate permease
LPAVLIGVLLSLLLARQGHPVDTIGSRFSFQLSDGSTGYGIPPVLPDFQWPWRQAGADGESLLWSWQLIRDLLPAAFSIAMLGAIESLLCAVVLDGMTGKRHSANSELLGQGIGNLIVPFFGGITATAAIARSTANFQAGAQSPVAAVIHALTVLLALLFLSSFLAYLPMASMSALLIMVARNMSEAPKSIKLIKTAPRGDILVLFCCLSLTVLFDMVIAITCGIVLSAILFIREMAEMTRMTELPVPSRWINATLPDTWKVIRINGPLFYAAADRIFSELALSIKAGQNYILYLEAVPVLDGGGLAALEKFIASSRAANGRIIISELQFQPLKTIRKANIQPIDKELIFTSTLDEAIETAKEMANQTDSINTPTNN